MNCFKQDAVESLCCFFLHFCVLERAVGRKRTRKSGKGADVGHLEGKNQEVCDRRVSRISMSERADVSHQTDGVGWGKSRAQGPLRNEDLNSICHRGQ